MSARYFGGEGVLVREYDPATCATPSSQWTGSGGEYSGCTQKKIFPANGGGNYPVQPKIKGQYHDEIVGGGQWEPWDDFLLGLNFTHRWLRNVIEDGTTADGTFVLANPGNIPKSSLDQADADVTRKKAELVMAQQAQNPMDIARLETELGNLQSRSVNLKGLAVAPKPTRRYTAMTFSLAKRFSKQLMVNAQYTYSRLTGNHNGLYDADISYAAPNGNTQYDLPELYLNKNGALANDRPHSMRVTGYYEQNVGPGKLTMGLVGSAYSGVPRNYIANLDFGYQIFLLPRGSAGRTPTVTQFDTKLSYRQAIGDSMTMEVFFDIFNLINSRTALLTDDTYTFDSTAAIVGGTKADLAVAKGFGGQPLNVNPNFGNARVFQAPRYGRIGLRLMF